MKAGPKKREKKGSGAYLVVNLGDLYGACEAYRNLEIKMTVVEFFKSSRSSYLFSGTKIQQQSFGRMLKKFDNRKLGNTDGKRAKYRNFSGIKDKLIRYIKVRAKKYKQEK